MGTAVTAAAQSLGSTNGGSVAPDDHPERWLMVLLDI